MAKDPAFLFYSSDFLTGTLIMPFEDRGKYITILAFMHQNGRLNEETIRLLVGSISDNLKSKFGIDNKGLWFNSRLEEEVSKRSNFVESRVLNGKKGGRPTKKSILIDELNNKPTDNLAEDVNKDEIINDLKIKKNELIIFICKKYGYEEMRFANNQREVSAFVSVKISSLEDLDNFNLQLKAYDDYKKISEEKQHSFLGLFGNQKNQFSDSALMNENWIKKLNDYKPKNNYNNGKTTNTLKSNNGIVTPKDYGKL